ncbi:hypothetical protein GCM10010844_43910 [Deinococcus radiotolerans]|uniref:Uncharacterized protein n=1 Tax=Deinococcus radiotolerans TaxID=1309407 RepID=A0ABQ2FRM7_9DEIO|nr:hypothetical protein GCM10010844_43910 [Deinococcus radiotolerans]
MTLLNRADHWGVVISPVSLQRFLEVGIGPDGEGTSWRIWAVDWSWCRSRPSWISHLDLEASGEHGEALPIADRAQDLFHQMSADVMGRMKPAG